MKVNLEQTAAYQGRGWKTRISDGPDVWSPFSVNSEWAPLKAVMLYIPRGELRRIRNPLAVQHLYPVAVPLLQRQMRGLAAAYRRLGVKVIELNPSKRMGRVPPNLMFMRDLFLQTPSGAVISRMASQVRAGEEKFAAAALGDQAVMIRGTITGSGLLEGSADAMWLTPRLMVVGLGARTNREGFEQLRSIMSAQGIECVAVKMPRGVQHLLGLLQIVDRRIAVVRTAKAPPQLLRLLKKRGFRVVHVQETDEVREKLGFNFVAVGPRRIIMAAGCPELRKVLINAGLRIAAEVEISQMCNAAGGIGCVTGILSRKAVK